MTRFWAHAFPLVPKDSPVHGKVGAAPVIAGHAGIAGIPGPWYLSVSKATKKADLAAEFAQHPAQSINWRFRSAAEAQH